MCVCDWMAAVQKLVLAHFRTNWFPTCWTDERADVLTTSAGGSKGEALAAESEEFIVHRALESISKNYDKYIPSSAVAYQGILP